MSSVQADILAGDGLMHDRVHTNNEDVPLWAPLVKTKMVLCTILLEYVF